MRWFLGGIHHKIPFSTNICKQTIHKTRTGHGEHIHDEDKLKFMGTMYLQGRPDPKHRELEIQVKFVLFLGLDTGLAQHPDIKTGVRKTNGTNIGSHR